MGRWARKPVNHTSWVALVTPTDRPKSVRNCCLIELFCGVVCVVTLPFWHFCWCRGFCHRTESDLFLFLLHSSLFTARYSNVSLNLRHQDGEEWETNELQQRRTKCECDTNVTLASGEWGTSTRICDDEAVHTHDNDRTETGHRDNRKRKLQLSSEKSFDAAKWFNCLNLSAKRKGSGKGPKGKATPNEALEVTYHFNKRAKCYSGTRGEHTTEPGRHHKSDYHGSWRSM